MAEASLRPCCLVIEDQTLIGMAIEAYLEGAGYAVGGPFCSCADALAWLREHTPELAIVDFVLRDGPCTDLARELSRRGVPFVVYSGRRRGPDTPPEFQGVPWIEKPADRIDLLEALAASPLPAVGWQTSLAIRAVSRELEQEGA